MDKIYQRKNLAVAWEKVKRNRGAGGIDGTDLAAFEAELEANLDQLHEALKDGHYRPQPVLQHLIPKAGKPGEYRPLGIPTIIDRVCQQALLNRLEPIFEPIFDDANFGYRRGRSTKDALSKIWRELEAGNEWVLDADLRDFFGSVDHEKLLTLVNQRVSDGRVLGLINQILKAGCVAAGQRLATEDGVPQGGVISPLMSNILLTPFDREMRQRGFQVTRYADDWVVTCKTREEAQAALAAAQRILDALGVTLHAGKTRIVHVRQGFDFLGYKLKRGQRPLRLAPGKIRSGARAGNLYAFPRAKSIQHFKDQIRRRTRRKAPLGTQELIEQINPVIRGWGQYYCKAHVRKLFQRLDGWIVRRLWSHRYKRWRNGGWKRLPERRLYGEYGLVKLIALIPSLNLR
ncbi:MAG: group II intron reverse transcriptase/maturase [Lamprobacter sp.]|uniref:group II intron reverse transcriptase/maturase n=1 Tax=Lamprobacter sp. TaxID=3100796 RepID=UPI002B25DE79|nr:group II intron reverse transcriptase/maturase [Lamprobacter sp.]MEA3643591.1 group II intron reverse transcriptase/maturase [Lamprobacter sp.]